MIVIREDRKTREREIVSYDYAIERLQGLYKDPGVALKLATEFNPAQTNFAYYWTSEIAYCAKGGQQLIFGKRF